MTLVTESRGTWQQPRVGTVLPRTSALLPHGGAVQEISPSHPFPPHNSHCPQAMAQSSAQAGIVPSSRVPSQFGGMGCSLSPCRMSAAGAPPHCLWLCLGGWTPRMERAGRWVEPGHGCSRQHGLAEGCQGDLGRHCSCCHPPCMGASSAWGATPPFLSPIWLLQLKCAQPQH